MRLLVIGRNGQVARALAEAAPGATFLDRAALDLADIGAIAPAIAAAAPDMVINAAAYTAVDRAEIERETAFAINAEAVGEIARATAAQGAGLIHLSTDYVYPGTRTGRHVETDPTDPINFYGVSKLAGERLALEANPRSLILRTAWVYSPWGRNFVTTMLALAGRDRLSVVEDQHGQPTSALDIAASCLVAADRTVSEDATSFLWGIYHFAGRGTTTWAGFARAIFAGAKARGMIAAAPEVVGIPTADYPTPARRPANSTLDCTKFEESFAHPTTPWETALDRVLDRIAAG